MGAGFSSATRISCNIKDGLIQAKLTYNYNDGLFFDRSPKRHDDYVRICESDNPIKTSKEFFEILTQNSFSNKQFKDKKIIAKMTDGTVITWREKSSSDGSPVVEINIKRCDSNSGLKNQKIHFTQKGGK